MRMVDLLDLNLLCPKCGNNYLHQRTVQIFNRDEDAHAVRVTTVDDKATHEAFIANELSLNPSKRRHGMRIGFYCEVCDGEIETESKFLNIAQHKGLTYIYWDEPDAHSND